MATVAQPTSNAFPVLSNGIDDSRIKNSTLIENATKVSVSKMKTHPSSYVSNPVSKQNGNYSGSSSDGESPPLVNGTASPKPHKTSQVILHSLVIFWCLSKNEVESKENMKMLMIEDVMGHAFYQFRVMMNFNLQLKFFKLQELLISSCPCLNAWHTALS